MGYKKAFVVDTSEIEGRLDPFYYKIEFLEMQKKLQKINYKSLSNLATRILDGIHKTPKYSEKGLIFLQANNINEGNIDFTKKLKYISSEWTSEVLRRYTPKSGDVLITKDGTIGISATVPQNFEDFSIFVSILAIRPKQELIIPEFLRIMISSSIVQQQILQSTKGAVISHLLIGEAKNLKIPLPPKETQNKIIQIMDNAYKIKKENEKRAKELLASIDTYLLDKLDITLPKEEKIVSFKVDSSEIFGSRFDPNYQYNKERTMKSHKFNEKYLSEISFIFKGQSITKSKVIDGIYPVIAGGQTSPYNSNVYNYEKNIITISASGAYAGYVWYHNYNIFASDCSIVKSKDNVLPKYLFEILKLKQKEIYKLQHGSAQPHIYPKDIKFLKIPLPPLPIQNEIASHIQSLRDEAKHLKKEAKDILKSAKDEVEVIILKGDVK